MHLTLPFSSHQLPMKDNPHKLITLLGTTSLQILFQISFLYIVSWLDNRAYHLDVQITPLLSETLPISMQTTRQGYHNFNIPRNPRT